MRASGINAVMIDLGRLLHSIDAGEIALPDFQRDFDWAEGDVLALLVTVFSGWPAGSLLLIKGPAGFFRIRGFDGGPTRVVDDASVVLDGQQRLTSLYHALFDKGPNVYAIDYSQLTLAQPELEDAIVIFRRSDWDSKFRAPNEQARRRLIPCYALLSASSFFEWRDDVLRSVPGDEVDRRKEELTTLYRGLLSAIHRYEFPAVVLENTLAPAAIARIFERVNRHGMNLGTFDLVVAKVYELTWNLRDKWEAVRRDSVEIDAFLDDDGMPILQTIALWNRNDLRQAAVLALPKQVVHQQWDSAAGATEVALKFLRHDCGVIHRDYLPFKGMLIPLAAHLMGNNLRLDRGFFKRWFWSKSFAQAFEVSSNTRLIADYVAIEEAARGNGIFHFPVADPAVVYSASKRSERAIWSAFLCALHASDPSGELDLLLREGNAPEVDDREPVSVFPKDLGRTENSVPPPHLRVLGLIAVSRVVARKLRKEGFSSVLRSAVDRHGSSAVDVALGRQFFPSSQQIVDAGVDADYIMMERLDRLATFLMVEAGHVIIGDESPPQQPVLPVVD